MKFSHPNAKRKAETENQWLSHFAVVWRK